MESVLGRYRNLIVLVGVLFAQVLGLAVQVRRTSVANEPTRLIRIWAVGAVTPFEKAIVWVQTSTGNLWHNYFYLRGVRAENRELKAQIEQMRIEQVRLNQDADQARRLQALLGFKEQFISKTMAAQVIGSSGSEQSRSVYIDKGERDGIKPDMAVITANGIVGKVLLTYRTTSLVLLINDNSSGVGAILEKSRTQGIARGTASGEVMLERVMGDETVPVGEQVLTSGGDRIFPKGLPVGTITKVSPGSELFLNIRVRPAADLSKLEEVLVVTKIDERQAEPDTNGSARAADILAERLPTVPKKVEGGESTEKASSAANRAPVANNAISNNANTTPKSKPTPPPNMSSAATPQKPATAAVHPVSTSPSPLNSAPRAIKTTSDVANTSAIPVTSKPTAPTTTPQEPASEDAPH